MKLCRSQQMQVPYLADPQMMYVPADAPGYVVAEEQDETTSSNLVMLAVAGAVVGAAIGYKAKESRAQPVTMSARREASLVDQIRNVVLAGLVSLGLYAAPAVAVDVKLGSDGGQLVFVPDEVKISAGDTVTWIGNKGMPHNVVFDEENVPDGVDAAKISHEDMVGEEGE